MPAVDLHDHKHKYKFVSAQFSDILFRRFQSLGGGLYKWICVYCYQTYEMSRTDWLKMWRRSKGEVIAEREVEKVEKKEPELIRKPRSWQFDKSD